MSFFKKKPILTLHAITKGQVVALADVNDPTFSQKMMGEGIAIIPEDGQIVAPCDGTLTMVFPTLHAFGMSTDSGAEILVHVGLDTVNLKGEGFTLHAEADQNVKKGDLILEVDLEKIKDAGYDPITPIVICNSASFSKVIPILPSYVNQGDTIIDIMK